MKAISSVSDLIEYVSNWSREPNNTFFRGHSKTDYRLTPKLFRSEKSRVSEDKMVSLIESTSPDDFRNDESLFEILCRAQHHGLPTRLLDFTSNPLVGLYFACIDRYGQVSEKSDGHLIVSTIEDSRIKTFKSDTISAVCALSRLSQKERDAIDRKFGSAQNKRISVQKSELNKMKEIRRLCQFVRDEKPYFTDDIRPVDFRRYYLVKPRMSHKRLIAQSGVFVLSGFIASGGTMTSSAIRNERLLINKDSKNEIVMMLNRLGINRYSLFPDIDSAAQMIQAQYS